MNIKRVTLSTRKQAVLHDRRSSEDSLRQSCASQHLQTVFRGQIYTLVSAQPRTLLSFVHLLLFKRTKKNGNSLFTVISVSAPSPLASVGPCVSVLTSETGSLRSGGFSGDTLAGSSLLRHVVVGLLCRLRMARADLLL